MDTTKKLCSDQAADVLELQVSCQNDLVHRENRKDMSGKATLVETTVIKGQLSFMVCAINITNLNPSPDENWTYRSILCDFTWNLWLSQKGMKSEPFCSSSINAIRQIHPSSQQQHGY